MKKTLLLITSNKEKLAVAQAAVSRNGFNVIAKKINCPEIQDDNISEIAKSSAEFASKLLKNDVVKIDSGLFIEALNEFPGPYSAYVEKRLKAEDIIKMMKHVKNRKAHYKEALAYCEYGKKAIVFETFTYGKISNKTNGSFGWNFDRMFIKNGDTKTMAHYDDKNRIKKYSNKNWKKLVYFLKNKPTKIKLPKRKDSVRGEK